MKGFLQWLAEALLYGHNRIVKNPSKSMVKARLHHSQYGELRYIHSNKTGDTHIGDAGTYNHPDLAAHSGEHFDRNWEGEVHSYTTGHHHAGFIDKSNIDHILAHPGGLKGWIKDHHKNQHDSSKWDDK
jgi:hypothetical protein